MSKKQVKYNNTLNKAQAELGRRIDYIYNEIDQILRHYTCPDSCASICCKYSTIQFEKDEYFKILNLVDSSSKEIIENGVKPASGPDYYRTLLPICPLLQGTKCSIYNNRPMVCRRYPFEMSVDHGIMIRPCALGINVILDYMCWSDDITAGETIYGEWLKNKNSTLPTIVYVLGSVLDSSKKLHEFTKYLNKTAPEDRKLVREECIKIIEESKSEFTDKQFIPNSRLI